MSTHPSIFAKGGGMQPKINLGNLQNNERRQQRRKVGVATQARACRTWAFLGIDNIGDESGRGSRKGDFLDAGSTYIYLLILLLGFVYIFLASHPITQINQVL
jgi:hypothetical protein